MAKFAANARVEDFNTREDGGDMCRLSYAQSLFKPRSVNGSEPKYGCTLIFPKAVLPFYVDKVKQVAARAWPHNGLDRLKQGLIKSPLLMGDGREARNKETGEIAIGLGPDVFFIRPIANADRPPRLHARGLGPHVFATAQDIYSGCYGFAVLNVFPWYHSQSGDGISFGIAMFQKMRDGDSLGGAAPVDSAKWYVPDAEGDDDTDSTGKSAGYEENPFA